MTLSRQPTITRQPREWNPRQAGFIAGAKAMLTGAGILWSNIPWPWLVVENPINVNGHEPGAWVRVWIRVPESIQAMHEKREDERYQQAYERAMTTVEALEDDFTIQREDVEK